MTNVVNPSTRVDRVGRSGVYPMSGPWPEGDAPVVGQGEFIHPEERHTDGRRPHAVLPLQVGRVLFGGFFIYNGLNHFLNRKMMSDYARSKNVPLPDVAVLSTGALLLIGGLSLLTGVRPRAGAMLVTTFLAGVSPKMHNFWAIDDEPERTHELVNFTKNMALIGGAAFAASVAEPWPLSPATVISAPGGLMGSAWRTDVTSSS